jgi:exosortase family protein XrtM
MSRRKKTKAPAGSIVKADPVCQRWWRSKGPVFRFGAGFAGLVALFSAISLLPFFQDIVTGCVLFDARLAGQVLNWLGQGTHNTGGAINSSRFAITVVSECSASEFVIFLWAGLIAFPTTLRRKIAGLIFGTLGVGLVNLLRIVTLFLVGVYHPHFFTTMHEELWPGLFIIAMILFAAGWAAWATRTEPPHASI